MAFDFRKLNGKIVEKYSTQYRFAEALGMSEHSLSNKLNNRVPWKTSEITKAMKLLGLDQKKVGEYFFTEEVQRKNEQKTLA